jgi:hypothetical protein
MPADRLRGGRDGDLLPRVEEAHVDVGQRRPTERIRVHDAAHLAGVA